MNRRILLVLFAILTLAEYTSALSQDIVISYRDKNLWGYADTLGNIIVKPVYDDVKKPWTSTSKLIVAKDKKWGVVSPKGKVLVPLSHNRIMDVPEGYLLAETIEGTIYRYTLFDVKGRVLLPAGRQEINFLTDRIVFVRPLESVELKNGAGVALMPKGSGGVKWLIPRNYSSIYFRSQDSVFVAELGTKTTEYKLHGTSVSIVGSSDNADDKIMEMVQAPDDGVYRGPIEESVITLAGPDTVINGERSLTLKKTTSGFRKKMDSVVLIGCEKVHILTYPNKASETFYHDKKRSKTSLWAIVRKDGKYGAYFSVPRSTLIPFEYDSIGPDLLPYKCKEIVVKAKKNGKWGLIRIDNTVVTDFTFDDVVYNDEFFYAQYHKSCFNFRNGLIVKTGSRYNILRDSATVVYDAGFESVVGPAKPGPDNGIVVREGMKKGYYKEGNFFPPSYEGDGVFGDVYTLQYHLAEINNAENKLIGYVDRKGILYFRD